MLHMAHVLNVHKMMQSVSLEAALYKSRGVWMNIYLPKRLTSYLE